MGVGGETDDAVNSLMSPAEIINSGVNMLQVSLKELFLARGFRGVYPLACATAVGFLTVRQSTLHSS